jgi:hypothetical protein
MHRALLMSAQHMAYEILLEYRIIHREYGPAGIAKNDLNTLVCQSFDHHFRTGHSISGHHTQAFHSIRSNPVSRIGFNPTIHDRTGGLTETSINCQSVGAVTQDQ